MLNPFPVQFLALFAYFFLRVIVGLICLIMGKRLLTQERTGGRVVGFVLTVIGIQFILGLYTQIAALVLGTMSFAGIFMRSLIPETSRLFLLLLWGVSFSLFITGAGVLAFDLPL